MSRDKKPKTEKPVAKSSKDCRKCNHRRHGVPDLGANRIDRAREKLLRRPLHESARAHRLMRKLKIIEPQRGWSSKD